MRHARALENRPDLAGVREEANLKKLPEDERKAWQTLWAEVNALLNRLGVP